MTAVVRPLWMTLLASQCPLAAGGDIDHFDFDGGAALCWPEDGGEGGAHARIRERIRDAAVYGSLWVQVFGGGDETGGAGPAPKLGDAQSDVSEEADLERGRRTRHGFGHDQRSQRITSATGLRVTGPKLPSG